MANHGFGTGGFPPGGFGSGAGGGSGNDDFESLARQYWSRWGEMLRAAPASTPGVSAAGFPGGGFPGAGFAGAGSPGVAAGMPGWEEATAWWSQLASSGNSPADAAVDRFTDQTCGWFAQMQQLAARFAGQDASAPEIAEAWKSILGGAGGNPFADALRDMHGPGQQGFEQWFEQVTPWLEKMQAGGQTWLGTPAVGFTREHQQRWQQLAQAQQDHQQQGRAYQALMAQALQDAFKRFEEKLTECSEPGKKLESARALFDLWIDAAEETYSEIALSPRFREAYGAMVNSQMRLRTAVQREIEQVGEAMGVPTRSEVDAVHRKIVQLERELRRLRDQLASGATGSPPTKPSPNSGRAPSKAATNKAAKAKPVKKVAKKVAKKAVKKVAKKAVKAPAKKVTKAPAKKSTAKKPAAKKPTAKKTKSTTGKPASASRRGVAKSAAKAR
ncbi:class III poly(R)-hydroxyalkanoic acid synthase subunit PhaE [Lysobacter sp. A289]